MTRPPTPTSPAEPDEVLASIKTLLAQTNFGAELAREGITTVALDDDGHMIENHPGGTATPSN